MFKNLMFKIQSIISKQHILVLEVTFSTKKEPMKPAYTKNPVSTQKNNLTKQHNFYQSKNVVSMHKFP